MSGFLEGIACNAAGSALNVFKGCRIAAKGFILISINCLTAGSVSLKINSDLSSVPKILEAARYLEPFTFSNKIAGPLLSKMRK